LKCEYDRSIDEAICEICQAAGLPCGEKLSAKEFKERIKREAEEEAKRNREAAAAFDTDQYSPRSKKVFDTVIGCAKRFLENGDLGEVDVLQRVAVDLHRQVVELSSPQQQHAAPRPHDVSGFDPGLQQHFQPDYAAFPMPPMQGAAFPSQALGAAPQMPLTGWTMEQFPGQEPGIAMGSQTAQPGQTFWAWPLWQLQGNVSGVTSFAHVD
jgi:hypothetical protein